MSGDWSSDVCSSDLDLLGPSIPAFSAPVHTFGTAGCFLRLLGGRPPSGQKNSRAAGGSGISAWLSADGDGRALGQRLLLLLGHPIEQSIKRKIEAVGTPLKDWDIQINYGIKTCLLYTSRCV